MPNNQEPLDSDLTALVIAGDKNMFAVLIERYETKLLRYAAFLIKDSDDAADIVQDSFIKAYTNLNSYNKNHKFSSWIYRIVHNEAMNFIKKHKKTSTFTDLEADEDSFYTDNNFDETIDKLFLKQEVKECLSKLDIKYSEVIRLQYFEHMTYEEIGEVLHLPSSTVGVRSSRAKSILKTVCERSKL
jgi:RNA polymerase sigma-70 factor, ECF subfamily